MQVVLDLNFKLNSHAIEMYKCSAIIMQNQNKLFYSFDATGPVLYPLKTSEKLWFQGDRITSVGWMG